MLGLDGVWVVFPGLEVWKRFLGFRYLVLWNFRGRYIVVNNLFGRICSNVCVNDGFECLWFWPWTKAEVGFGSDQPRTKVLRL